MDIQGLPLRQTDSWAKFMELIGWEAERCGRVLLLVKKFPFRLGSFVKILDLDQVPRWEDIFRICRKQRCWLLHVQTILEEGTQESRQMIDNFRKHRFGSTSPLTPSRTIWIDLMLTREELLAGFRSAVRTDLRRAEKLSVEVVESDNIEAFAKLWQSQMRRKGDWLAGTREMRAIAEAFGENIHLLVTRSNGGRGAIDAGVLLIHHGQTLHYLYAASTPGANAQKVPTQLVWESLKLGRALGCQRFDFEGVLDQRFAKQQKSWQGFSRFKGGFGGRSVVYLSPFRKRLFPFYLPSFLDPGSK